MGMNLSLAILKSQCGPCMAMAEQQRGRHSDERERERERKKERKKEGEAGTSEHSRMEQMKLDEQENGAEDEHAFSLDREAFKAIYPREYLARFVEQGVRPDNRRLGEARRAQVSIK